jgi:hypothetical protein
VKVLSRTVSPLEDSVSNTATACASVVVANQLLSITKPIDR